MDESDQAEQLHPGHRSLRIPGFDYTAAGLYFVTICSYQKQCTFGKVKGISVELTPLGRIVRECLLEIPRHFARAQLHEFAVMPNHLHFILGLVGRTTDDAAIGNDRREEFKTQGTCRDGAQRAAPLRVVAGSLGAIVRSFKAAVSRRARVELRWSGEIWQKNYFERVIRDGKEYADTARYVVENPMRWGLDEENPDSRG